jgi:chromosome segregation ATPase
MALSDAIVADVPQGLLDEYRSRPKQLARRLLVSRDQLRAKCKATKVELKRLKVRVSDVSKSREEWQKKAEFSEQQMSAMQTEIERLSALVEQVESLKKIENRSPV